MISHLKLEIQRCIRVLGFDRGSCQNDMDIDGWLADGLINHLEASELRKYSRDIRIQNMK